MTGPEHYAEGDRLMEETASHGPDEPMYAGLVAAAQAHYTAAHAAATALGLIAEGVSLPSLDRIEWLKVAGTAQERMTPRQHGTAVAQ